MSKYCPLAAATGEAGSLTSFGGYVVASSPKITGNSARSVRLPTSCVGEYDSRPAPESFASCNPLAIEFGACFVSASVNSSHCPCAILTPLHTALHLPLQPSGRGPGSITRTGKPSAIDRVPSVDL